MQFYNLFVGITVVRITLIPVPSGLRDGLTNEQRGSKSTKGDVITRAIVAQTREGEETVCLSRWCGRGLCYGRAEVAGSASADGA